MKAISRLCFSAIVMFAVVMFSVQTEADAAAAPDCEEITWGTTCNGLGCPGGNLQCAAVSCLMGGHPAVVMCYNLWEPA